MIVTNSTNPVVEDIHKDEIVVVIPNDLARDCGEPLTDEVIMIINGLVNANYWPLDWGEGDDTHTTLYFVREDGPGVAARQAAHFIKQKGEV